MPLWRSAAFVYPRPEGCARYTVLQPHKTRDGSEGHRRMAASSYDGYTLTPHIPVEWFSGTDTP